MAVWQNMSEVALIQKKSVLHYERVKKGSGEE